MHYLLVFIIITVCGISKAESRELSTPIFRLYSHFIFVVIYVHEQCFGLRQSCSDVSKKCNIVSSPCIRFFGIIFPCGEIDDIWLIPRFQFRIFMLSYENDLLDRLFLRSPIAANLGNSSAVPA